MSSCSNELQIPYSLQEYVEIFDLSIMGVRVLAIYSLLQPVTQQVALVSLFECTCVLAGTGIILILYLNKQKLAACVD